MRDSRSSVERAPTPPLDERAQQVLDALRSIRYGAVEVLIHDGRIVQIERREKQRFDAAGASR